MKSIVKIGNWKVKIVVAAIILVAPFFADAAIVTKPPNNLGLAGYWPFEEGSGTQAGDHSGSGNSGTLTNMENADWIDGRFGKALAFDGVNEYVNVPNTTILNPGTGNFTISVWIRVDSTPTDYTRLINKGAGANYYAFVKFPGDKWKFELRDGTLSAGDLDFGSSTMTYGNWTHLVATVDQGNGLTSGYLDGVLKDTSSIAGYATVSNTDYLSLGRSSIGVPYAIDNVRVYSRALAQEEVQTIYDAGVAKKSAGARDKVTNGLVGYWSFDGSSVSGTTVTDDSGSGKNGTTSAISLGDGADGAVTITAAKNINTETIAGGRSYADGIAYRVVAPADSATSVTRYSGSVTLSNGIAAGDEVLLINLQGASGDTADVGDYEIMEVSSVAADTITFTKAISKSFDGTTASNQKVVIQRIPNYTNVTLSSSGSLTASAWDGLATVPTGAAGYYTGIVALKASGTVSIASGTSIHANAKGYRGGAGSGTTTGVQGESYAGTGTNSTSANLGAGGGGGVGYGGDRPGDGGAGGSYGAAASNAGGGALAGSAYGTASLSQMFFGSGAGGGGTCDNAAQAGGAGGNGGGIVFISAGTVTVSGGITVNGAQGSGGGDTPSSDLDGGPGGGGAGGSIFIVGSTISAGSSITTSTGGAYTGGFNNLPAYSSTAGAVGRIEFEKRNAGSFSGIASPAANEGISGPVSGSGRIGQALDFDGTDDYISVGNVYNGVKSVSFWIKADNTTKKILDLNGTAYVEVSAGTITATGWTSPTIYVDGAVSSTIDTNWHHVTITSSTGINASAVDIGRVSTGYFDGALDDVRFYSSVLSSASEIAELHNLGVGTKVNVDQNSVNTSGLVGMWSFNGPSLSTTTATDDSGNGKNGTLANSPTPTRGVVGQALDLSPSASRVDLGTNPILHGTTATGTVCAWAKSDNLGSTDFIYSEEINLTGSAFLLAKTDTNQLLFEINQSNQTWAAATDPDTMSQGQWYHMCGTFNGSAGTVTLYVNGVQKAQNTSWNGTFRSGVNKVWIGNGTSDTTREWDGALDEIRAYTRELSASEVLNLYQQ